MSSGFLTTHVLDTARGVPAAGLHISLFRYDDDGYQLISTATTNADGRTDSPILPAAEFAAGQYRLVFHAGAYLEAHFSGLPDPKFLSDIPIDFAMADDSSHYHVPLLLSPFGYSTYRGS
jgi:5-hydroxyisourate hydrolase